MQAQEQVQLKSGEGAGKTDWQPPASAAPTALIPSYFITSHYQHPYNSCNLWKHILRWISCQFGPEVTFSVCIK